ncbi:MAG: Wzz/FepE/Etk N-terminal domain-containing protein [Deltaproteobacteria bacterium]|nr:Wzz/FepE/Etk N-terminal domain-containing protein [Deltaproteobacteria bacterium]
MDHEHQQPSRHEDEIELIDILRIIWKWKWLITVGVVIVAVAASVISLQMPKVYQVDAIIEPGIMGVDDKGNLIYIDSPDNISRKVGEQAYNQRIMKDLHVDPHTVDLKFKSDTDKNKNSQVIMVSSEWEENEVDLGIKVQNLLIAYLTDNYRDIINQKKNNYDSKITTNQNKINDIDTQRKDLDKQVQIKAAELLGNKNELKLKIARLESVEQQVEKLFSELKEVKDNSVKMTAEKDALLKKSDQKDALSLLLHATTLQQNITYFNELNSQIFELRKQENEIETDITKLESSINSLMAEVERLKLQRDEGLKTKIDDINAEIQRLKSEQSIISNIKVIQEPEKSTKPVKSRKVQIVMVSAVGAFFFLVILAFFIEYVRTSSAAPRG